MVATDFLDYVHKFSGLGQVGVEDFADKFNALYSVAILIICIAVVTIRQYFMDPLACYTGNPMSGKNVETYLNNYCWVEGTINIRGEDIPNDHKDWKSLRDRTLLYYQWVPFVLALQCVLFIIPRLIWQILTYNRTGTDLESLVKMASEATTADLDGQKQKVQHIACTIKNVILSTRNIRRGRVADLQRKLHKSFSLSVISKRMGTWVSGVYLFIKIVYLCNSVGQIYLIQRFLGVDKNYDYFGLELTRDILNGKDWRQTKIFPRVTFCKVGFQHLGANNQQTSQCVLGINFLNEKIYIFLWFWFVMASIVTIISIPLWLLRLIGSRSRSHFIKKNLLLTNHYKRADKGLMLSFIHEFLRHDGLFILRMLALNAGDLITSEVVASLWEAYRNEEGLQTRDMSNDRHLENGHVEIQMAVKQDSTQPQSKSKEACRSRLEEVFV